jgi:hypothetical protein
MLIDPAWRRHLILDAKSGTGGIPGMRRGKQDEARRPGSADATATRNAAVAGLIPSCP